MELKDFIEKTVADILEATEKLQSRFDGTGAVVNPPISSGGDLIFDEGNSGYTKRRIELVEFDLAVTVSSDVEGGGGAGIKILGAKIGAEGKALTKNEEVSRVKFAMPLALAPSKSEAANRVSRDAQKRAQNIALGIDTSYT